MAKTTRKIQISDGRMVREIAFDSLVGDGLEHILSIGFELECKSLLKLTPDAEEKNFYISRNTGDEMTKTKDLKTGVVQFISSASIGRENTLELFGELENDGETPIQDITMLTTNDVSAQTEWEKRMITLYLEGRLLLRREDGSTINIKQERSHTASPDFPSVEWKILYLNPPTGQNIILQCFTDACTRVQRHLDEFTREEAQLTNDRDTDITSVVIYHHKNEGYQKYMTKGDDITIKFRPQLTFRVNAENLYSVVERLEPPYYKRVGSLAEKLIHKFGTDLTELQKRQIKGYLLLFFDMLKKYIRNENTDDKFYLKDATSFLSRHSNAEIFKAMRTLDENVHVWLVDDLVRTHIFKGRESAFEMTENPDPKVSYRKYIERLRSGVDVLREDREDLNRLYTTSPYPTYGSYSTQMDLVHGEVIVEWRGFFNVVEKLAKPLYRKSTKLSLDQYMDLKWRLVEDEIVEDIPQHTRWNPTTRKHVELCGPKTYRNKIDWTCTSKPTRTPFVISP